MLKSLTFTAIICIAVLGGQDALAQSEALGLLEEDSETVEASEELLGNQRLDLEDPLLESLLDSDALQPGRLVDTLGQNADDLLGNFTNDGSNLTEGIPEIDLSSLLKNVSRSCSVRESAPLNFDFGALMPGTPSPLSALSSRISVDCVRPAAYRLVIVDGQRQRLFGSTIPAIVTQADGSRTNAALVVLADGKPLGQTHRNNGRLPNQHEIAVELRTAPQVPLVPAHAGRVELDLDSAYLTVIDAGSL